MNSVPVPIAFCITDLDAGGAERCLVQLVSGLNREEWTPRVYCLGPEAELAGVIRQGGIEVTCLGARSARSIGVIPRLATKLRRQRPRLLQCFLFHANLAGRIAGRRARVPVIVSGARVAERQKRWHLWADRWTRALAHHTVCVSRDVADFSIRNVGLRPETVTTIPNGVDFARFADAEPAELSALGIPPDSRMILSAGRLHPQKGHELLIEAVDPILKAHEHTHLVIAGDGPLRGRLECLIANRKLTGQVHLIGFRSDLAGLMRAATVFVMSSIWEGMPNVLLEAMSAGAPIITTPVEGVDELISNGNSGIVVNSFSANDLRAGIEQCLQDPELRHRLALSSQHIVKTSFTVEVMVQNYAKLYRRLLEREYQ